LIQLELERAYLRATDLGEDLLVVHGACPTGADAHASAWVQKLRRQWLENVDEEPHEADWNGPRKRGAGFARNAEMVNLGADLCLAFILDESAGATHTEQLARKAGIETKTFRRSTNTMASRYIEDVQLDNVRVVFKNFTGREEAYNAEGQRNFHVVLPEETAEKMIADGWNVKKKDPREEGEKPFYHMKVKVSFKVKPPRVTMVTKKWNPELEQQTAMRTLLTEDLLMLLDHAEFDRVDMILNASRWEIRGEKGVTAYLKTGFFFIHQDPLEERYASIPDQESMEASPVRKEIEANDGIIDGEVVEEWDIDEDQKELAS
jgi:hypothetical protein